MHSAVAQGPGVACGKFVPAAQEQGDTSLHNYAPSMDAASSQNVEYSKIHMTASRREHERPNDSLIKVPIDFTLWPASTQAESRIGSRRLKLEPTGPDMATFSALSV
uniref:Uncharacterized protein n=1 Tax=Sphaerodactylus townsendi TaxID=933632 RepID=A0ACB8EF03_9SAUR